MNNVRKKVERSGVQEKQKIQRPRCNESGNAPMRVVPTHFECPFEKIYKFPRTVSSSSSWRLALKQDSPGIQHHLRLAIESASRFSASCCSVATGSASASATRLILWHGWPGLLQKASASAMASDSVDH